MVGLCCLISSSTTGTMGWHALSGSIHRESGAAPKHVSQRGSEISILRTVSTQLNKALS